jgi:hypothetical protein
MEDADQGKEPARRGEVGFHFPFKPLQQKLGRMIVNPAAGHVDGLDLARAGLANRLVIGIANREVFPDGALEAAERQNQQFQQLPLFVRNFHRQPAILHGQAQAIRPFVACRAGA